MRGRAVKNETLAQANAALAGRPVGARRGRLRLVGEAGRDFGLDPQVKEFGVRLWTLAREQAGQRRTVEIQWATDVAQFNARYWDSDLVNIEAAKKMRRSSVYANLTRRHVNHAVARIGDMLFPVNGLNFGIDPTPLPDLIDTLSDPTPMEDLTGVPAGVGPDGAPATLGRFSTEMWNDAKARARAMERKVADLLAESKFESRARQAIESAALYGTGVLKGPVVAAAPRKGYVKGDGGRWAATMRTNTRPGVEFVDLWGFFPDMSAMTMEEASFVFEHRSLTRKQVSDIRFLEDGVSLEQLGAAMTAGPGFGGADSESESQRDLLRWFGNTATADRSGRWSLWCYTGPVEPETYARMGLGEKGGADPVGTALAGEPHVVAWMIGPHVVRVSPSPLPGGELPYSVFTWDRNPASVFGFGLPYATRDSQRMANAAWRQVADNSALTALPMFIVGSGLTPQNGNNQIGPGKIWRAENYGLGMEMSQLLSVVEIPNHVPEFLRILDTARGLMDQEAMMPAIAQGDVTRAQPTSAGTSTLANAANAPMRRLAKCWDDNVTVPLIGRFFEWVMAYDPDESAKGDHQVVAKGSTTLLSREVEANTLLTLQATWAADENAARRLRPDFMDQILRAHGLRPEDLLRPQEEVDAEIAQEEEAAAEQPPEPDPAVLRVEVQRQLGEMKLDQGMEQFSARREDAGADRELKLTLKNIERDIAVMRLAGDNDVALAKIQAELAKSSGANKTALAKQAVADRAKARRDEFEAAAEAPNPRIA